MSNYLGAYIELEKITEIIKEPRYTCSNTECDKHGERRHSFENFCSHCSAEVTELEFDTKYLVDLYDLTGIKEDQFHIVPQGNSIFLLPNFHTVKSIDTELIGALEITKEIKEKCISSYTDFYEKDIELIKQHYDNVVLRFGLVTYF